MPSGSTCSPGYWRNADLLVELLQALADFGPGKLSLHQSPPGRAHAVPEPLIPGQHVDRLSQLSGIAWNDNARPGRRHLIGQRDMLAHHHRQTRAHGLGDRHAEVLVVGGQDEQISPLKKTLLFRAVNEPHEAHHFLQAG